MSKAIFESLLEFEQLTMKILWDAEKELSYVEIKQRLHDKYHRDCDVPELYICLSELERKGYLKSYRKGKELFCQILVPFKEYRNYITREFMHFWYHGSSGEADARIALEAYNTLMEYCKTQENCENCLMAGEDVESVDCIMKLQDYPKRWQQLNLD